ncbi:MAG: DNA mismatch repair protein MutT [Candidatus Aenigmatarchaeota archaeon]|nr:MAG: DNA mismatch repair protein MutT [Candidatus Aenigmarchaeota archaeon]
MELKKYKAVKALIQYKNKFLLLKKEDFIGGEYELPGGRKKPQENDESALKREVKEESGLDIKIIKLLNSWSLDLPEKGTHLDGKTYLCESYSDKVKISEEHSGYIWVPRENLRKYSLPSWLEDAINQL